MYIKPIIKVNMVVIFPDFKAVLFALQMLLDEIADRGMESQTWNLEQYFKYGLLNSQYKKSIHLIFFCFSYSQESMNKHQEISNPMKLDHVFNESQWLEEDIDKTLMAVN